LRPVIPLLRRLFLGVVHFTILIIVTIRMTKKLLDFGFTGRGKKAEGKKEKARRKRGQAKNSYIKPGWPAHAPSPGDE
jgi:hypothetical protein